VALSLGLIIRYLTVVAADLEVDTFKADVAVPENVVAVIVVALILGTERLCAEG
jgi:hypothetical protein